MVYLEGSRGLCRSAELFKVSLSALSSYFVVVRGQALTTRIRCSAMLKTWPEDSVSTVSR